MQLANLAAWGAAASTTIRGLSTPVQTLAPPARATPAPVKQPIATLPAKSPVANIPVKPPAVNVPAKSPVAPVPTRSSVATITSRPTPTSTSTAYSVFFSSLDPNWYLDESSKLSIYTSILSQITLSELQEASKTAPGHPQATLPVPLIPFYENSTTEAFNLYLYYPQNRTLHGSAIAPCIRPSKLRRKAKRSDYAWCPVPDLYSYELIFRDDLPVLWQAWGPLEGVDLDARGPSAIPIEQNVRNYGGQFARPQAEERNPHYYGPIFDSVNRRKQLDSNMDFGVDTVGRLFHWETIVAPDEDGVMRDKPTWPSYQFLLCDTVLDGQSFRVFTTGVQIVADAPYANYTNCDQVNAVAGRFRPCLGSSAQGCTIER